MSSEVALTIVGWWLLKAACRSRITAQQAFKSTNRPFQLLDGIAVTEKSSLPSPAANRLFCRHPAASRD
jgi:hypothetical protein